MKCIAIIPARGGSKRIPRKNIKEFCGKPIIAYSIQAALDSGLFDEVMVSTDDPEIAEVAKKYGASVPFYRSAETANDFASTGAVLNEVMEKYKEMGQEFDYMSCIYPCAPFVTGEKLKLALKTLIEEKAASVKPVVRFSYPPQRSDRIENGRLIFQYPEYASARSQDLEPIYHDCGQFYFYDAARFYGRKPVGSGSAPLIMPEEEVQDVDTLTDWRLAEVKYKVFMLHQEL